MNSSITSGLSQKDLEAFYSFGQDLILTTRKFILELWNKGDIVTELKTDTSPVTQVDLKTEEIVRNEIRKRFPTHDIVGEEYENDSTQSEFQWVIDPIDGTQNLINRIPTFGTLLGLRFKGEAVLGFIDHPALGLCVKGGKGLGVYQNDSRVLLSDLTAHAFSPTDLIATSSLSIFQRGGSEKAFYDILKLHSHTRIYYDCYAHSLTVSGSVAGCVEADLNIWDVTPLEALIKEAGGACHYFGRGMEGNKLSNLNVVFGKRKAVAILTDLLSVSFSNL